MGVLRAKVGGTWVDIFGGTSLDEVAIGPDDPGDTFELWYDTDATAPAAATVESANFTPAWAGFVVGTGGVSVARYVWIGGPDVGDHGQLTISAYAKFGSSGQTFPTQAVLTVPTGFEYLPADDAVGTQGEGVGQVRVLDATPAQAWIGPVRLSSAASLRAMMYRVDGTNALEANIAASWPITTWAVNDSIAMVFTSMAKRV